MSFGTAREALKQVRSRGGREALRVQKWVDTVFKSKSSLGDEGRAHINPFICYTQFSHSSWIPVAVWNVLEQDTVAALDLHDFGRAEVREPLSLPEPVLLPSPQHFGIVALTGWSSPRAQMVLPESDPLRRRRRRTSQKNIKELEARFGTDSNRVRPRLPQCSPRIGIEEAERPKLCGSRECEVFFVAVRRLDCCEVCLKRQRGSGRKRKKFTRPRQTSK